MIEISFSNKAKDYLKKKNFKHLLVKTNFFSETCVQIYEPKIAPLKKGEVKDLQDHEKVVLNGLDIYVSKKFLNRFIIEKKIEVDLQRFPKKLIIKNIDPIVINVCKIEN